MEKTASSGQPGADFTKNPYGSPLSAPPERTFAPEVAAELRRGFLRRETVLRLLGGLLLVFGLLLAGIVAYALADLRWESVTDLATRGQMAPKLGILLTIVLCFLGGWHLIFLDARGRWPAFVATLILVLFYGFIANETATPRYPAAVWKDWILGSLACLAAILCLVVLASPKGGYILSAEYRSLLRATPRMRWWRTPFGILALLVLALVFVYGL